MKLFFDDEAFDGQLQRSVGKADSGMANVGECLEIASQITGADRDSWYRAWSGFASMLEHQGEVALAAGHDVSARDCFLRATEYFRQAFFFHRDDLDGVELRTAYAASVQAFRSALPHLDNPGDVLDGSGSPAPASGYLFVPPDGEGPFPTILHIGGYDGTAEELYASAAGALSRGYAFAPLDGPGQGSVLYDQRVTMRPDWENVVPGMVDLIAAHDDVDATRIVLVGRSFGGLLAPRGAAGDDRIAALVVDPGQYDLAAAVEGRLGDLWKQIDDPAADDQFASLLTIPAVRSFFAPRMVTHGFTNVREFCGELRRFHNRDAAPQVRCPTLVTDNETDLVSPGQGQALFDNLTGPKAFRRFTKAEGAEGHCEGMAQIVFSTAAFDWIDETLT